MNCEKCEKLGFYKCYCTQGQYLPDSLTTLEKLNDLGFYVIMAQTETSPVYYLGDKGDESVGIWPLDLTPYFDSEAELKEYVNSRKGHEEIRNILIEVYSEEEVLEWEL